MCLAIPAKVIKIDGKKAEVDFGGNTREVSIVLTPQVKVGDYVLLHAGFAIQVIDEKEAQEIYDAWEEAYAALQK